MYSIQFVTMRVVLTSHVVCKAPMAGIVDQVSVCYLDQYVAFHV